MMTADDRDPLVGRLLATIAGRAPTDAEESTMRSTLSELPPVYHEALDALLDQRSVCLDLTREDAAWSWQLQTLAAILPGAEVTWDDGVSMKLTLERHEMPLIVDHAGRARVRVALEVERRLVEVRGGELALVVKPALEPVIAACEIHCVAGCCGLIAFEVATSHVAAWVKTAGLDAARAARRELEVVIDELAAARETPVTSARLNASWRNARECEAFFRGFVRCLDEVRGVR
jgi:hypothetical protein